MAITRNIVVCPKCGAKYRYYDGVFPWTKCKSILEINDLDIVYCNEPLSIPKKKKARKRKCSKCGKTGHNSRTCKE